MSNQTSKPPIFTGEKFERITALSMAIVGIIIAVIALLQTDVGSGSARAKAQSQQYAIQVMNVRASGQIETGFAWADAYRHWVEWDNQANFAGDAAKAERYRVVRDRALQLSPLLASPYFDPDIDPFPNIVAFEANAYVIEATALTERYINAIMLADELGDKEDAYSAQVLLLAVTLFLYGLSMTVIGRVKWFFVGIGTMLSLTALVWMVIVYIQPITVFPDRSINTYAEGVGLAYQGDYKGAVTLFDRALVEFPNYANVHYARAKAHYNMGNYDQAVNDYNAAINAGLDDVNVSWNLGWAYYILGQFDESIDATQSAIEQDPAQVALTFNVGLAHLAQGDMEMAEKFYQDGIELAVGQVLEAGANGEEAPASLWWYLDVAASDLDSLLICLSIQTCDNAPPYDSLTTSDAVQNAVRQHRRQMKNATVSLEYLGKIALEPSPAIIGELEFAKAVYDEEGKVEFESLQSSGKARFGMAQEEQGEQIDTSLVSSDSAQEIHIIFSYEQMEDGQHLVIKIYNNDTNEESFNLRVANIWTVGPEGKVSLPLTPSKRTTVASGEYRVELYVDGYLTQEGGFLIE